jgi:hypothetical protein
VVDETDRPGIDRRTLIRRAATTGALAWTAPMLLDSLRSPAGAITGTPGCYRLTITPTSCETSTTALVDTTCPVTTTQCSPTNEPAGQQFSKYCLSADSGSCSFLPAERTFRIDSGCSCTFLAINGETNNNMSGESGCGGPCIGGSIIDGGKRAVFLDPGGDNCRWVAWNFIILCP